MPIFSNSSLAIRSSPPGWILRCHFGDQLAYRVGHARSATPPGFPFPKETKPFAMPTDQRVRFDNRQGISPIEKAGQSSKRKANSVVGPLRSHFPLNVQGELFA